MGNETKWICIMVAVILGIGLLSTAYEAHQKAQCRIALKDKSADEILKVCK